MTAPKAAPSAAVLTRQSAQIAERHAEQIRAYWAERGYEVDTRITQIGFQQKTRCVPSCVQSNLVNGLPKGYRPPSRLDRLRKQRGHV